MDTVLLLLSVVCLGVSSQPITDNQRLFSIAVSRVQHLHLLAQRLFSDFVSLQQLRGDNGGEQVKNEGEQGRKEESRGRMGEEQEENREKPRDPSAPQNQIFLS